MFENIEKARQMLNTGSVRAAIDEFVKLIQELKSKDNSDEAIRMLKELITKLADSDDKRHIYQLAEKMDLILSKLEISDFSAFTDDINKFFSKAKDLYREVDQQFDKSGELAEIQAKFYESQDKDASVFYLEAGKDYSSWAVKFFERARIREEDQKNAEEYITKASKIFEIINREHEVAKCYKEIVTKLISNKNEELAESYIDKAVNYLLELRADEAIINTTTDIVMEIYVVSIENKISHVLNPEAAITKLEEISFENSVVARIIRHAKDICLNRKVKSGLLILAKELTLIGVAIFDKEQHAIALPYFKEAKDYYLEVGNDAETKNFGETVIAIGLQLFTNERYPMGRDYFNIAIEIGEAIDRKFQIDVFIKQAELFLKYNKFQLAYEAYKQIIIPLQDLPEDDELRMDIPSAIRQLAKERFDKSDFHYAELFYRLTSDFFYALDQIELAADTYDLAWQPMFEARQLQTGIDLARKAADAYIKAGKEESAADVYFKLALQLLDENHLDIALEQLYLTAETIPEYLREEKFKPLVQIATKYTEECIKNNDIINAQELWKAACEFNETLSRSLITRDVGSVVEAIENHIENVVKFDMPELNEVTYQSAIGSGNVLSEAGEHERAAATLVSFAVRLLRKDLTEYANKLYEQGAEEYIKANNPIQAARALSTIARYHAEHENFEKSYEYYLLASLNSKMTPDEKIFNFVAEQCVETFNSVLSKNDIDHAEKGFKIAVDIMLAVNKEAAARIATEIGKKFADIENYPLSIQYYSQAIDLFLETSTKNAIIVGAETIERGRKAFQKAHYTDADKLIILGIDSLFKANQEKQAAQTAQIEGEKFLVCPNPEIGLNMLNKAIQIYKQSNDLLTAAEVHQIKGRFYIQNSNPSEGLQEYHNAGNILLEAKKKNNLKKMIQELIEQANSIISSGKTQETDIQVDKIGLQYYKVAEDFSVKIGDSKLNSGLKYSAWKIFSQEELHDSAFISLEKTYDIYAEQKNLKSLIDLSQEVTKYSNELIQKEDLVNAIKYINLTIDELFKVSRRKVAAGICMSTCETFLKQHNNEVAVSWGLRGADILTEESMTDEAIKFLEELVDQLMERNSIENAALCYGKIAKILEQVGRMKEIEETALKVMAFGTANMKNNNIEAGLRLWEVALTIGSIVGEEFTGRLCVIEGQTFFEIKNYGKSIELFKESHTLFTRTSKLNRLVKLGDVLFDNIDKLEVNNEFETAYKYLPIAFESYVAGKELTLATDKMFRNARKFIEAEYQKEGAHLINSVIDMLFTQGDFVTGIERCFIGAATLISYGMNTEGSKLIDKGMEQVTQIDDEPSIKHLATVCRNQGIILRDEGKLEASHIILASGIGILRTINDLIGIGQISIDLGRTLVKRNEMSAAVEAYRNGVQLLAQGNLMKESANIVNELITEGRKQIDNDNVLVGVPLVELSGELFILLNIPERIMMISEIFINLGGKMLAESNYEQAALYFAKAMEFATQAGLRDYLPKVGNRCIDFGLKLVKEEDPILGLQFMNAGADLISQFEKKPGRAGRALSNYIEAVSQVISPAYEKSITDERIRMELIGQFIDSTIKFFTNIQAFSSLEELTKLLLAHGKKLLKTEEPRIVRQILEPALRSAENANNTKLQIEIANTYLEHVGYLIEVKKLQNLEITVNQALNIYLEVNDLKEIRKFMGIMAHSGRELCLKSNTSNYGRKIISILVNLADKLRNQELFPVLLIPIIHLNQQALEIEDFDLVIFARQNVLSLLQSILDANMPLAILGNVSLSNMIFEWFKPAEFLILDKTTFDQAIKIINQVMQLAVLTQEKELGVAIYDKVLDLLDSNFKRKTKGLDVLYEILAISLNGLGQDAQVVLIGNKCLNLGKAAGDKKRINESIDYLKAAGRIFASINNNQLISDVAIICAQLGDLRIKEKNVREGLYYYAAALENYELSKNEESIKLIATTIENLFSTAPIEDGYICYLVPGMVYANRGKIKEAEVLAKKALDQVVYMIDTGKKDMIYDSIQYLFTATDIYEQTGNFAEEVNTYDRFMITYLKATSDSKIIELFLDLLLRTITKKLSIWDFASIDELIEQIKDQRVGKNKTYIAINKSIQALKNGRLQESLLEATKVNVKFERNIRNYIDSYKEQIKNIINESGKLSIHEFMENQPISNLINILIQDLYARKEIEGKYFPIGLFVDIQQLNNTLNALDTELAANGKAVTEEIANKTSLTLQEALSVMRIEYLPQKFQATFNEDNSVIYSYQQLRNEVRELSLGYQDIGNIDINKISQQLKYPPDIIQREIEYLILEGKINPRLVGSK